MSQDHLVNFYQNSNEIDRFASRSQSVEFLTTTRVLEPLLLPEDSILDIGAGPGQYALHFGRLGHRVTAIDPVPKHIDQIQAAILEMKSQVDIHSRVGDHTTLVDIKDESFGAVLCFGPLYHLPSEEERTLCVAECIRTAKTGGLIAFAYISKFCIFPYRTMMVPELLDKHYVRQLMESGEFPSDDPESGWTDCYYCSPDEAVALVSQPEIEIVKHVGTDGIGVLVRDMVDNLDEEQFSAWLDFHFRTCEEPSLLGYSNHGMIVCRKREI